MNNLKDIIECIIKFDKTAPDREKARYFDTIQHDLATMKSIDVKELTFYKPDSPYGEIASLRKNEIHMVCRMCGYGGHCSDIVLKECTDKLKPNQYFSTILMEHYLIDKKLDRIPDDRPIIRVRVDEVEERLEEREPDIEIMEEGEPMNRPMGENEAMGRDVGRFVDQHVNQGEIRVGEIREWDMPDNGGNVVGGIQ